MPESAGTGPDVIWTERTSLAYDLWAYGEDSVWKQVLTCPKRPMDSVGELAESHLFAGPNAAAGGQRRSLEGSLL